MDRVWKLVFFACIAVVCSCAMATKMSKYKPVIPAECRKLRYCNVVPNYPQEVVNKLIDKIDNEPIISRFNENGISTTIGHRYGAGDEEACESMQETITPQAVLDDNGTWRIVLQSKEKNYTQGHIIEICNEEYGNCNSRLNFNSRVEKSQCRQLLRFEKMWVMEKNNDMPIQKSLKIPSCCTCMLTLKNQ